MFTLLLFCLLLHTAIGSQADFGKSYLKESSNLCKPWTCLSKKLNLPNALPPKEEFRPILESLLPPGDWQKTINQTIEKCYNDRPRRYTNTCPGQSLLHCTIEHLIKFCPDESLRKDDACAPVTSLAGFKYMFTQSRYQGMESNLHVEKRPTWFLKNYFSSPCCNLPEIFNKSLLSECGFNTMIQYHDHEAKIQNTGTLKPWNPAATRPTVLREHVHFVDPNNMSAPPVMDIDPMDCCDMSGFIEPSWRQECGFKMTFSERYRLTITNSTVPTQVMTSTTGRPHMPDVRMTPTTTTARPQLPDVKVVPQSCNKSICVFRNLGILDVSGELHLAGFSKLLDNLTAENPVWSKAKARVVTKCLTKPLRDYPDDCEINKVLACTFDVLSENCPHAKKHDLCKHSHIVRENLTCQISSSKLRPKYRRQFCGIPNLVNHEVLNHCGIKSLSRMEYVAEPPTPKPKTHWWVNPKLTCQESSASTKCLLNKMGVLSKYGFLDYFKMKDRIRDFTSKNPEWAGLTDLYFTRFTSTPMYAQQCSTTRKLLNVLDTMLSTCPVSRRKPSPQCNGILNNIAETAPADRNIGEERHYHGNHQINYQYHQLQNIPEIPVTHRNPPFNFGFFGSNPPKVEIVDVKSTTTKKPLVLLPVYMRMNGLGKGLARPYDGIMRSNPVNSDSRFHMAIPSHPQMLVNLRLPQ